MDAPDSIDIPRHRKRATKKPFVIRWHYTATPPEGRFTKMLFGDYTHRYATEKAARQAIEGWRAGRGTWGAMRRPPEWAVELVVPS